MQEGLRHPGSVRGGDCGCRQTQFGAATVGTVISKRGVNRQPQRTGVVIREKARRHFLRQHGETDYHQRHSRKDNHSAKCPLCTHPVVPDKTRVSFCKSPPTAPHGLSEFPRLPPTKPGCRSAGGKPVVPQTWNGNHLDARRSGSGTLCGRCREWTQLASPTRLHDPDEYARMSCPMRRPVLSRRVECATKTHRTCCWMQVQMRPYP